MVPFVPSETISKPIRSLRDVLYQSHKDLFIRMIRLIKHCPRDSSTEQRASEREGPTVMNITTPLLEMPPEVRQNVDRARSETVSKLWMATEKMNILYPENWTRKAAEEILWFQGQGHSFSPTFPSYPHLTLLLIFTYK